MSDNTQPTISDAIAALFESVSSDAASSPDVLPNAAARKRAAAEALKNLQPGQLMADGTIFLGKYTPKDLSTPFNVFAAPEDLPETMTYNDTVTAVAGLEGWHGHDGARYADDKEIYAALKDGSYGGGWIIPPRELLSGTKADSPARGLQGDVVQPDNLFDHRNTGSFKKTFETARGSGPDYPHLYWSSSEERSASGVWSVDFADFDEGFDLKDKCELSCRPVRLVKVEP
jgi:hypothetical protein